MEFSMDWQYLFKVVQAIFAVGVVIYGMIKIYNLSKDDKKK